MIFDNLEIRAIISHVNVVFIKNFYVRWRDKEKKSLREL